MAILNTVKKIIPYLKTATGYVLYRLSSQAVEMDDGTILQDKIESMDSIINTKAPNSHNHTGNQINGLTPSRALISGTLGQITESAVTSTEIQCLDGVTSNIQTQLNNKAANSHTHTATQITGLTASRAMISDSSGHPAVSNVTAAELNYLDGATSNIQDQIDTLNSNLTIQTYTADGINIWKFNGLCFGMITKTFTTKEAISPWGGQRTIGNISNADFRPPYEVHCPCVGVNAEDGVTYPLRIIINSSGAIVVQNDSADYIGPQMIYANYFYKK